MSGIRIHIAHSASIAKSGMLHQRDVRAVIASTRVAKARHPTSNLLFQCIFAIHNLLPCCCIIQRRQITMFQRVGSDVKMRRQLAGLRRRHHRFAFDVANRQIEGGPQLMTQQQIGDARIQRMTIIHRETEEKIIHQ